MCAVQSAGANIGFAGRCSSGGECPSAMWLASKRPQAAFIPLRVCISCSRGSCVAVFVSCALQDRRAFKSQGGAWAGPPPGVTAGCPCCPTCGPPPPSRPVHLPGRPVGIVWVTLHSNTGDSRGGDPLAINRCTSSADSSDASDPTAASNLVRRGGVFLTCSLHSLLLILSSRFARSTFSTCFCLEAQ